MTTNFLYAQAPNRKGNISKDTAKKGGGVTAVTRPQGNTTYAPGHQTGPKAGANPLSGRGQKVSVSYPKCNDAIGGNTGYIAKDGQSWLK
jgi:hypothetical protein